MKNKAVIFSAVIMIVIVVLGCGLTDRLRSIGVGSPSDSASTVNSATEKVEATPSGEIVKIGIEQCDDLATYISDNSDEIDGSFLSRGIVYMYKNMIVGKIKEGIEKLDEKEKEKIGEACEKSLEELKKSIKK